MPHIDLNNDLPGIAGLLRYRPQTARPLTELAEVLLRGPNTLTPGERELIAAYVSSLNHCAFCTASHSAAAAAQLEEGMPLVEQVHADLDSAPVSEKMRALLRIAGLVQRHGSDVGPADVQAAREVGATDVEIHDTVLIAAAFCMFNRYVDGLATVTPDDPAGYAVRAREVTTHGYRR
ncbi:MAG TPA: peroxidase-related enzyme [Mycobacteriales bacterium]